MPNAKQSTEDEGDRMPTLPRPMTGRRLQVLGHMTLGSPATNKQGSKQPVNSPAKFPS